MRHDSLMMCSNRKLIFKDNHFRTKTICVINIEVKTFTVVIVCAIKMEKPFHFAYNPNQRQFIEDDRRYKEKISQMNDGRVVEKKLFFCGGHTVRKTLCFR